MASVSTYLNFNGNTEEVFKFYKSIFGGEFLAVMYYKDVKESMEGMTLTEKEKNMIMHTGLKICGGHIIMGTDVPASMNAPVKAGSNQYICLNVDSKKEADDLFAKLSTGGVVEMPMADMFWGDYFGSLVDKFEIKWMLTHTPKK